MSIRGLAPAFIALLGGATLSLAEAGQSRPDLRIGADDWDSSDPVEAGEQVDFEIEVANGGAEADAELVVEGFGQAYTIERVVVQRAGPIEARDQCAIDQDAGQVQCLFVELGRGDGLTVEIRTTAQVAGEYAIEASLTSDAPDGNPADNFATQTNTISGDTETPSPGPTSTSPPGTSTSPEETLTAEVTVEPTSAPSDETDGDDGIDWTPWLLGTGLVLLVAGAGLLAWLAVRRRLPDS